MEFNEYRKLRISAPVTETIQTKNICTMLFPCTPTTPSILYGVSSPEDTALIRLPDYVGQSEIVDLMSSTFSGNATVQEIILPKHLRILRENAFSGCTALRCIWIPKTVRDIPEDVFLHCDALETVYYEGSKQMWEKLPIRRYRDCVSSKGMGAKFTEKRVPLAGNETLFRATVYFDCIWES